MTNLTLNLIVIVKIGTVQNLNLHESDFDSDDESTHFIDLDSDNETSLPKAHSVHDQYLKEVIESVKMKMKQQSYSFYKSNNQQFWIRPPDPTFIQQYDTDGKISPIHFYKPDIFVLFPFTLYSQIHCPNCLEERKLSKLHLHGYRYRRVLSLDRYYYLLYRRLHCPLDQGKGQLSGCGGSFSEHSPNIIRQLPSYLSNIVP